MTCTARIRHAPWRFLLLACLLTPTLAGMPVGAAEDEKAAAGLRLKVAELARTVDLNRGKEEFLTVTVEVSGADPVRLRRVQPVRADFQLLAGKAKLPCRWLRGGSVPDDPSRLRFTLGFSLPPASVARVDLVANLPRLDGEDVLELRLADLKLGQEEVERSGPGWSVKIYRFAEEKYVPPALPKPGQFVSKAGPVDVRVFRKSVPNTPEPQQAVILAFHSPSPELYDATLDVSGQLTLEGGVTAPLLSALLRREPSATVEKPRYPPFVIGQFYFPVPAKGRVNGALLRLHRRSANNTSRSERITDLPVPGR